MSGISLKIPLSLSPQDGFYSLTKNFIENTKQNIKMIVLTSPGERVMDPLFGVGLKKYLFEQISDGLFKSIRADIVQQVSIYVPYVEIIDITFFDQNKDVIQRPDTEANVLSVEIKYAITNLNVFDNLFIEDIPTGI